MYELNIRTVIKSDDNSPEYLEELLKEKALPYLNKKLKGINFKEVEVLMVLASLFGSTTDLDELANDDMWIVEFLAKFETSYSEQEIIDAIDMVGSEIVEESGLLIQSFN